MNWHKTYCDHTFVFFICLYNFIYCLCNVNKIYLFPETWVSKQTKGLISIDASLCSHSKSQICQCIFGYFRNIQGGLYVRKSCTDIVYKLKNRYLLLTDSKYRPTLLDKCKWIVRVYTGGSAPISREFDWRNGRNSRYYIFVLALHDKSPKMDVC